MKPDTLHCAADWSCMASPGSDAADSIPITLAYSSRSPILNASVIHYLEMGASQRCFSMPLAYTIPLFTVLDGNLATGI
ncbi:hypothetical protein QQF64_016144 [Cirrhinus molitorella]|uniref:Uncharacterized protein n=1 Tax=Cirrhinus molitorella TaxID=172907 RepID=A0ABR3LNN1_9TELE